jgi:parallel beta-helix repeat protein
VISGNDGSGVVIAIEGTMSNTVSGNYIGLDANGESMGNDDEGVLIDNGASNNVIGGDTPAERNVIAKNDIGVAIEASGSNRVSGNTIGLDANGTTDGTSEFSAVFTSTLRFIFLPFVAR